MKKYFLSIKIINNEVILSISSNKKKLETEFKKLSWTDQRDLSEKLLKKIDLLLKKNNLSLNNISGVNFSGEKYGFMTGQIGKITAKVLNFGLSK
ncbi:MAG: hypothetical protein U9P70_03820 [Patescibacteria group bacterium]|nr:hypothetical protein [Patescibacteria group bacterium]